jgi:uncharacterized protein YkwD
VVISFRNRRTVKQCARAAAYLLVFVALAACMPLPPYLPESAPLATPAGAVSTGDPEIDAFIALADAHRRALGCAPMLIDPVASQVAEAHSEDMRVRRYFSHNTPEGVAPWDRLRAAGVGYRAAAENIVFGHTTGARVFERWIESESHRANLENCTYTHHGVGRSEGHWTHVMYRPL